MSSIGKIEIAPQVIIDIVFETVNEVDGVADIALKSSKSESKILKNLVKLVSNKNIEVELGETECVIDLGVSVYYGENIKNVVEEFQTKVKENVEKLTGKRVNEININVSHIVKRKEEAENV